MKPDITTDPRVMHGKPVIRGTRITVENVLERLGSGESIEDVLEAYPQLSAAAVRAALAFAAKVLGGEIAYPTSNEAASATGNCDD